MGDAVVGIFRDGESFVLDIVNHRFPNRCVKTNEDVGQQRQRFDLCVWGTPWDDFFEVKESIVASTQLPVETLELRRRGTNSVTVPLAVPIVKDLPQLGRSSRGKRVTLIGVPIAVLSLIGFLGSVVTDSVLLPLFVITFLVGFVISVVGVVMLLNPNQGILEIRKLRSGLIWVIGADERWLALLPPYVEPVRIVQRAYDSAQLKMWVNYIMGWVTLVAGLILLGVGLMFPGTAWRYWVYLGPSVSLLIIPLMIIAQFEKGKADRFKQEIDARGEKK